MAVLPRDAMSAFQSADWDISIIVNTEARFNTRHTAQTSSAVAEDADVSRQSEESASPNGMLFQEEEAEESPVSTFLTSMMIGDTLQRALIDMQQLKGAELKKYIAELTSTLFVCYQNQYETLGRTEAYVDFVNADHQESFASRETADAVDEVEELLSAPAPHSPDTSTAEIASSPRTPTASPVRTRQRGEHEFFPEPPSDSYSTEVSSRRPSTLPHRRTHQRRQHSSAGGHYDSIRIFETAHLIGDYITEMRELHEFFEIISNSEEDEEERFSNILDQSVRDQYFGPRDQVASRPALPTPEKRRLESTDHRHITKTQKRRTTKAQHSQARKRARHPSSKRNHTLVHAYSSRDVEQNKHTLSTVENFECVICTRPCTINEQRLQLHPCEHVGMCRKCIASWRETAPVFTCPLCRSTITAITVVSSPSSSISME